jgi:hypothetical protein
MTGPVALVCASARARSIAAAVALLATLGMLSLFASHAEAVVLAHTDAPLAGSDFQAGDGDQDRTALLKDWQDFGGFPSRATAPDASPDFTFVQGSDENDPGGWIEAQTTPSPPKTNFLSAWSVNDGDEFFYYAFNRQDSGGNTHLAFELNQDRRLWHNRPGTHPNQTIPCRTTGDIAISYSIQSNLNIDVVIEVWETIDAVTPAEAATFPDGVGCAQAGAFDPIEQSDLPGGSPLLTDLLQAAINTQGPIDNYLSTATFGDTIAEGEFGEGAVNLTDLFTDVLDDPCFSFGSFWMHGRSSQSPSSALQDYIDPVSVVVRSCTISGTKYHDVGGDGSIQGDPVIPGWKLYLDLDDDDQLDPGEPTALTDADGFYVFEELSNGSYTVREAPSSAQSPALQGYSCTFPSRDDDECEHVATITAEERNSAGNDFGNAKPGKVIVKKVNVGGTQSDAFPFTSQGLGAANASFSLAAGDATGNVIAPVAAGGSYSVTEGTGAPADKYDLTALDCDDADSTENLDTRTATIKVSSGETVTCTFTNTRKQGQLTVRKVVDPATDPGKFDLSIGNDLVVDDGGHLAQGTRPLPTGSGYTVSEAAGTGTSLAKYDSSVECKDGATTVASGSGTSLSGVPVVEGRNVICTFTNVRRPGTIQVVKELVPATDQGRFDLAVDGTVVKAGAGDGQGGSTGVAPGSHTVSEAGAGGTSLASYDSSIECKKGDEVVKSGTGTSLSGVTVDSNQTVVCTITNIRRGSVTVSKTEAGGRPEGTWTFRLTGGPDAVDITKDTQTDGNPLSFGNLKPGSYTLCEVGMPIDWHSSLENAPHNGERTEDEQAGTAKVCVAIAIEPGEAETVTVDNTRPSTLVIKEGNVLVHHGEAISYTFNVSNNGNTPLEDVSVEDDRCDDAPVRDAANDRNADGDALLEGEGTPDATKSEVWRFTCTRVVSAEHDDEEENPIHNVATAHAFDLAGNEVTATDDHDTTIIHPGIGVNKTLRREGDEGYLDGDAGDDPIKVHVGDTIEYRFEVTNEGDTSLDVDFSDPKCDDEPASPESGDDGDGELEVGETWIYRCSHVVANADADPLENTVTVTGTDEIGGEKGTVRDSDTEAADVLHPDIEVDKRVDRTQAHVGDTLTYRFDVTNAGDTPLVVAFGDPRCDAGTLTGPAGDEDEDGLLDVGETWAYGCSHVVLEQDPSPLPNTAKVTGTDELGGVDEDEDSTSVKILKPGMLVVKEGNQFAYPGDTVTFTFTVTNSGNAPLSDVTVTDDRCAPVTRSSGDELLDPGEQWTYTCSKQVPPGHKIGEENPIRNVATATGKDALGKTVSDDDDHLVRVLHPAIDIEKTGPASALVGTPLGYTLTVTNPGDVPFARQDVVVADPRCEAPPAGPSTGADGTPGQLDPGDSWTYTCTAQTAGRPAGTFVNTATVVAKDFNGRQVTDTDELPTVLEAQQVLPGPQIVSGTARLRGPSGCVRGPFTATVRGRRIATVTFYRDGKKIKTITARPGQRTFTVKIKPTNRRGVHTVTARVRFRAASQTRARTLRLSYQRCRTQIVRPRFTG